MRAGVGVVALESVPWVSDPGEGVAARSDGDGGPVPHDPACQSDRHRSPPTHPTRREWAIGVARADPLYDIRRLLLVGEERLSGSARRRIDAALAHRDGDRLRRGGLRMGSQRTLLREVYAAENLVSARNRLEAFHGWAETVDVPEIDSTVDVPEIDSPVADLGRRNPQLSPNRRYQRTNRSSQPDHRIDPSSRTRFP